MPLSFVGEIATSLQTQHSWTPETPPVTIYPKTDPWDLGTPRILCFAWFIFNHFYLGYAWLHHVTPYQNDFGILRNSSSKDLKIVAGQQGMTLSSCPVNKLGTFCTQSAHVYLILLYSICIFYGFLVFPLPQWVSLPLWLVVAFVAIGWLLVCPFTAGYLWSKYVKMLLPRRNSSGVGFLAHVWHQLQRSWNFICFNLIWHGLPVAGNFAGALLVPC